MMYMPESASLWDATSETEKDFDMIGNFEVLRLSGRGIEGDATHAIYVQKVQ